MRKKMIWKIIYICMGVFFAANSLYAASLDLDKEIKQIKENLIQQPRWLAFKAAKKRDISICDSAENENSRKVCFEIAQFLRAVEVLANSPCDKLPYSQKEYADLCEALKKNNCSSLSSGYKRSVCDGLLTKDVKKIKAAFSDIDAPNYVFDRDNRAENMLNLYNGFKNKSERACSKFTSSNLLMRSSCNMLFGDQKFEEQLDAISQDLAYAQKYKECDKCVESGDTKYCSKIKDKDIKAACYDNSIKSLEDILHVVWY